MSDATTALAATLHALSVLAWREGWCGPDVAISATIDTGPRHASPQKGQGARPVRILRLQACDAAVAAAGDHKGLPDPMAGWGGARPYLVMARAALVLEGHGYAPNAVLRDFRVLPPTPAASAHTQMALQHALDSRLRSIGWRPGMDISDPDLLWRADTATTDGAPPPLGSPPCLRPATSTVLSPPIPSP